MKKKTQLRKKYEETMAYYMLVKNKPQNSIKQRALMIGLRRLLTNYNRELAACNRQIAASKVYE